MLSLSDRKSDGSGIAQGIAPLSQTVAVTAPETEAATEDRMFKDLVETLHHVVTYVTRELDDEMMRPLRGRWSA